jgi:acyl-CoA thioester hydrolase
MYKKILQAGWGDMDFNGHMGNRAYLDKAADVRVMFFAEHGFPASEFARLRIGPVIQKDELEYFREVNLLEEITVTYEGAGLSEDGSRFIVRNEFFRADGKLIARVTSTGGWLDLSARKLIIPPVEMLNAMKELSSTSDFQQLPSSIK